MLLFRTNSYVNSLPIGIQCLLTGWIHLPKTDCLFLGFLKYAMNSWMKPEMLTSSSSRFSFTSKILHRILRSQQVKVKPLWMKVGGRSPRTASASLSSPLPLLRHPPRSLSAPTSQELRASSSRRFLHLEFETTWLGDLSFPSPLTLIIPWVYSRQ